MVELLYEFNPLDCRRRMPPPAPIFDDCNDDDGTNAHRRLAHHIGGGGGGTITPTASAAASSAAAIPRFWPSYVIDQHVAQLDFDASVVMMAASAMVGNGGGAIVGSTVVDGDDDDVAVCCGGGMAPLVAAAATAGRGGAGGRLPSKDDANMFGECADASSTSTSMALMLEAAAAADPSGFISTDSLDMEQLRVRCECRQRNDYKLTFEDSGQWTTSGIGGGSSSFSTNATASPPVPRHQQRVPPSSSSSRRRRTATKTAQQQLLPVYNCNNNNNNDDDDGGGDEHGQDGIGTDASATRRLYTAIMDNHGLGLRLLEELNNDHGAGGYEAEEDNNGSSHDGIINNSAAGGGGGHYGNYDIAIAAGHDCGHHRGTAEWRKNSFMDELLNNNNNNNCTISSSTSSSSSQCHFRGDGPVPGGGPGTRGTDMMTTWGRLQQQDDHTTGGSPQFNADKVYSLPELYSANRRQQHNNSSVSSAQHQQQQLSATTTTFANACAASSPAMALPLHHHQQQQQQHVGAVQMRSANGCGSGGTPTGMMTTRASSAAAAVPAAARPTSSGSLVDAFIGQQQQRQYMQLQQQPMHYEYTETYLGNGRYIDMNENEIGYVPSCTAPIQRGSDATAAASDNNDNDDGGSDRSLDLVDLRLRRRELLGAEFGAVVGEQQQQQQQWRRSGGCATTTPAATPTTMTNLNHYHQHPRTRTNQHHHHQHQQQPYEMMPIGVGGGIGTAPAATPTTATSSSNNCSSGGGGGGTVPTGISSSSCTQQQQQRRTFADLLLLPTSRTVPDLKFIALAHNVPAICPSSASLDNLLCRVRNGGAARGAGGTAAAMDDLIDCCASSERLIAETAALDAASDGQPDSGLGSSHSDGPSHIEDWSSLSVLLPRNVLDACSFFKTNSFLLTGSSSNNIEGRRRPSLPPPRSFTSGAIWRPKTDGKVDCLKRPPLPICHRCCLDEDANGIAGGAGAIDGPSTPTFAAAATATAPNCCCCCIDPCTRSAVFASPSASPPSLRSRAALSQKLRLHARELTLIGLPIYDQKRAIIERVVEGVAEIVRGASSVVLLNALERLLSDELLPGIRLWTVICTVTGQGPVTRNVYQLIQQLEASEKPDHSRIGHFLRGLLQLHSLDGWLSYVVLKEHALRPFYAASAFLCGAQTAYRSLYWRLVESVELLSVLNQCGEAGKRWLRRQQQQLCRTNAATNGGIIANDGTSALGATTTATCAAVPPTRLPRDSRVPKSSSMPTKLCTSSSATAVAACIVEEEPEEEQQQEIEGVRHDDDSTAAAQQHGSGIKLEDIKLVEEDLEGSMMEEGDQRFRHGGQQHSTLTTVPSMNKNNNSNNSAHMFRPSRIPIICTSARSTSTSRCRSSSVRPTPFNNISNPSAAFIFVCAASDTITDDEPSSSWAGGQNGGIDSAAAGGGRQAQRRHQHGGTLLPLCKGERVRVLSVRGERTRCCRLSPPAPPAQRLALLNGVVPTRMLQFVERRPVADGNGTMAMMTRTTTR